MLTILNAIHALQQVPILDPSIEVPSSSIVRESDRGVVAHTNHLILRGAWKGTLGLENIDAAISTPIFAPSGYSPSQIRAAYNLAWTGGSGAHAVVVAYHYKNALRDFNVFSAQYGLKQETSTRQSAGTNKVFQVVYQNAGAPVGNTGWNQEAAMDIEWSHAMAPAAKIYLVEANSASVSDLNATIKKAASLPGVRSVSMSFSTAEFSGAAAFESLWDQPNVVFFASSGDIGGQRSWPAMSPNVVAVGGTSLKGSGATWTETAWSGSGGGISAYFGRPTYQNAVQAIVGTKRGNPDIAAVADPFTGCAVYAPSDQTNSAWMVFGGTSLACPIIAGIYNQTGLTSASSSAELTRIYGRLGTTSFRDITSGKAGPNSAKVGYDFCTGVGTLRGTTGF